jgi:subtilase family serine protease
VYAASAAVHPFRLSPGSEWVKSEVLELTERPVEFVISLKESVAAVSNLKKVALAVSDPSSASYGKFLGSAQLKALTAPKQEDVNHVTSWIESAGVTSYEVKGSRIEAKTTVEEAEKLFATKFATFTNKKTGQVLHRAEDYTLPDTIEERVQAVFGLHGFPLPKTGPLPTVTTSGLPAEPAKVTPAVLEQVYGISGVTPSAPSNRQAVAEFQGQYMSDKDLAGFFAKFVSNYTKGKDDVVSKYVGDKDKQEGQTEASLDIQYMMGVSPGLKSEFWLYNSMDFCGDLANWTSAILSDDAAPTVHSISYGWQGNLTQIHCEEAKVKIVDDNFAKLAAKGISIIFASGDSGSGYSPNQNQCGSTPGSQEEYTGDVLEKTEAQNSLSCCEIASEHQAAGWTFTPSKPGPPVSSCYTLPSTESWHGTASSTLTVATSAACCDAAKANSTSTHHLRWTYTAAEKKCELFAGYPSLKKAAGTTSGFVQPAHPPPGSCAIYSKINGTSPNSKVISAKKGKENVVLWPSWPASSGWITAVGSTRFVNQKIGAEEMATDQFGSGGGFSRMFTIADDASYQATAVKTYLAQTGAGFKLPPAGSFPPGGRATPDVSALGEGYQVLMGTHVQSVGGTSASTPAFAGMVGLLNDARIQAGKKQLGFLNPFIYQNTDAFTDITKGNNAIGRGTFNLPYGFNCTQGWDPVTGVGTPIFGKLLAAALKA